MEARRKNVLSLLDERTKKYGERIALGTKTPLGWKEFTYKGIGMLSRKLACYLIDHLDVKKGDRLAILSESKPEYGACVFASAMAGMVTVPLDVKLTKYELNSILSDCEPIVMLVSNAHLQMALELQKELTCIKDIIVMDEPNSDMTCKSLYNLPDNYEARWRPRSSKSTAFIIYTSGTTGHPKGAMLSHGNMLSDAKSIDGALKWHPSKKFLLFLPIFHSYTLMTSVLYPIYLGCSIIMFASVMELKTKKFRQTLIFKRPRVMVGVPQVYQALIKAQMPKWFIKLFYPIQLHISGGAPISADTLDAFEKKFGVPIVEGYGLSEAAPVVAVNTVEYHRADSVGKPMPGIQVKIVDEEENEVPVGEVGELIVKGGNVMKGYYHMPKATDDAIRNGWLFTGDFAKLDEDGFIYIVDRKKDLIISKGMNVYPREVEDVIKQLDGIEAVAVIGAPIEGRDEMILAYVMKSENSNITAADIKAHLKERLASFKTPKHIFIVDELPLTATGKVLKRELKAKVLNGEFKID